MNQARLEVEKDKRAEKLAERYLKVSQQREQERHDELRRRSHVIRREADQTNDLTLSQHRTAQQLALIRKY